METAGLLGAGCWNCRSWGGREGCAGSAGWEGCEPGPSWFDGRSLRSLLTMGASGIVLAKTSQRQHFRGAGEREA